MPHLVAMQDQFDGQWEPELQGDGFFTNLIKHFAGNSYFGELDENDELKYFVALIHEGEEGFFWLFYVNKNFRSQTRKLVDELFVYFRKCKFNKVRFSTTNISLSYERWVKKFGAKKTLII